MYEMVPYGLAAILWMTTVLMWLRMRRWREMARWHLDAARENDVEASRFRQLLAESLVRQDELRTAHGAALAECDKLTRELADWKARYQEATQDRA